MIYKNRNKASLITVACDSCKNEIEIIFRPHTGYEKLPEGWRTYKIYGEKKDKRPALAVDICPNCAGPKNGKLIKC